MSGKLRSHIVNAKGIISIENDVMKLILDNGNN